MNDSPQVSTGIEALDRSIAYLRSGDTVTWQIEDIGDYVYVATRFVSNIARISALWRPRGGHRRRGSAGPGSQREKIQA